MFKHLFACSVVVSLKADSLYDISRDILDKYVFHQTPKYWFEYIPAFIHFKLDKFETNKTHSYVAHILKVKQLCEMFVRYKAKAMIVKQNYTIKNTRECLHEMAVNMNHAKGKQMEVDSSI